MLSVILVSFVMYVFIPFDSYHLVEGDGARALWH